MMNGNLTSALGRDWLVDRAVAGSRWKGRWWRADIEWRTDLLSPGNKGRGFLPTILRAIN